MKPCTKIKQNKHCCRAYAKWFCYSLSNEKTSSQMSIILWFFGPSQYIINVFKMKKHTRNKKRNKTCFYKKNKKKQNTFLTTMLFVPLDRLNFISCRAIRWGCRSATQDQVHPHAIFYIISELWFYSDTAPSSLPLLRLSSAVHISSMSEFLLLACLSPDTANIWHVGLLYTHRVSLFYGDPDVSP